MQKLVFSVVIDAPREKVWSAMLDDETYRTWTEAFAPGSHYVGDWSEGSEIRFLAPDETGETSGMVSRIRESRPYEYISIEHVGTIKDGRTDTSSEAVSAWAGARENYTFRDRGGATEVVVEMDTLEEHAGMFQETWPRALQVLKELAETRRAVGTPA